MCSFFVFVLSAIAAGAAAIYASQVAVAELLIGNNFQYVTDVSQLVFEFNNDECRGKVPLLLCCHGSDWAVLQV